MGHFKCDHIERLITLTSDYIKRLSLYLNNYCKIVVHPVKLKVCLLQSQVTSVLGIPRSQDQQEHPLWNSFRIRVRGRIAKVIFICDIRMVRGKAMRKPENSGIPCSAEIELTGILTVGNVTEINCTSETRKLRVNLMEMLNRNGTRNKYEISGITGITGNNPEILKRNGNSGQST